MIKKYIKTLLILLGIMFSISGNAHNEVVAVTVDSITASYEGDEFIIETKYGRPINYGTGRAWPGVISNTIVKNHGKYVPVLMYLVDGNKGLSFKVSNLPVDSKLDIDIDTWWRLTNAVTANFITRYGIEWTPHPVTFHRSEGAIRGWGQVEALGKRIDAQRATAAAAAAVEAERIRTNTIKLSNFEARVLAAEELLVQAEEGLIKAKETRELSDTNAALVLATDTKVEATAARSIYEELDIRDKDQWKENAAISFLRMQTIITRTVLIITEVGNIKVLTTAEKAPIAAWEIQLLKVTSSLTVAKKAQESAETSMANEGSLDSKLAAIKTSKQANSLLSEEIKVLESIKRTAENGARVDNFKQQYQTLYQATAALEVSYAEAKNLADQEIAWQTQLSVVNALQTEAVNAVENASELMMSDNTLSDKFQAIQVSKQANAAFLVEIRKLERIKSSDEATRKVNSLLQKHQTLEDSNTALKGRYDIALESKQSADREAAWHTQLLKVKASHTEVINAEANAALIMLGEDTLADKLAAIQAASYANTGFLEKIRKLDTIKRANSDISEIQVFEQAYQVLHRSITELKGLYVALVVNEETLTGQWQAPAIKGLDYKTDRHLGTTDNEGVFRCQPGETITFSIADLVLTTMNCREILDTNTTQNISLTSAAGDGFKDWQNEEGSQVAITKVLFGLFGASIEKAFSENDKSLRIVTIELAQSQRDKTKEQSLSANDLSLLVENILDDAKPVVLPTTMEANTMISLGWQRSEVFNAPESKKSTGGGCVYNPNAKNASSIEVVFFLVLSVYYLIRRKRNRLAFN